MFFMIKYPPARSSFPGDATAEEKEIMGRHVEYWTNLMNQGHCLVFGPVMDPNGFYGLGVVQVDDVEQVREFIQKDPAVAAGLMNVEYHPMGAVTPKK